MSYGIWLFVLPLVGLGCDDSATTADNVDSEQPTVDSGLVDSDARDAATVDSSVRADASGTLPKRCAAVVPGTTQAYACVFGPDLTREGLAFDVQLRVVAQTEPDDTCFSNSKSPKDVYLPSQADSPRGRIVGWRFNDSSGQPWVVEFISDSMPEDLLSVGSAVTLEGRYASSEASATGHVGLRDATSTIAMFSAEAAGQMPPLLAIGAISGGVECVFDEGHGLLRYGVFNTLRSSITLGAGETGEIDGFRFTNEFNYVTGSGPGGGFDGPGSQFVFLAYRVSGTLNADEDDAGLGR